jgi:hypothetical protein
MLWVIFKILCLVPYIFLKRSTTYTKLKAHILILPNNFLYMECSIETFLIDWQTTWNISHIFYFYKHLSSRNVRHCLYNQRNCIIILRNTEMKTNIFFCLFFSSKMIQTKISEQNIVLFTDLYHYVQLSIELRNYSNRSYCKRYLYKSDYLCIYKLTFTFVLDKEKRKHQKQKKPCLEFTYII